MTIWGWHNFHKRCRYRYVKIVEAVLDSCYVMSKTFFNWFWNLFFKMPIPWSMSIYHDYIYKYLRLLIVVNDLKVNNAADLFNIYFDELRNKCQLFMAIFFIFINASFWLQSQRFRKVLEFIFWWFIIILIQ